MTIYNGKDYEAEGIPPHCDQFILHAPGTCQNCDTYPNWQKARERWKINFTGQHDPTKSLCPSELRRPVTIIHRWPNNQPVDSSWKPLFDIEEVNKLVDELLDENKAVDPPNSTESPGSSSNENGTG